MAQPTQPTQPTHPNAPATQTAAKKKLPPHYEITVEGTALIKGVEQPYEVTVKAPDLGEGKGDGHYMTFILSADNGEILLTAINKKYGLCPAYHTHYLVSREFVDGDGKVSAATKISNEPGEALTVQNMRKTELLNYIKSMKYNINTELYKKVDELREAVLLYQADKEKFLERQLSDERDFRIKEEAKLLNE